MTPRERIRAIIAGKPADRCGFWMGNPHPDTLPIYHAYFGTSTLEELHLKLGSDLRWLSPQLMESTYRAPDGGGLFDVRRAKKSLGEAGPLAHCVRPEEIEAFDWPRLADLNLTEARNALRSAGEYYRASGFWAPFFHDVMDLLGVEEFMSKMFTHPDVVHAVIARVCGFYLEANEFLYDDSGGEIDGYFFGNDFGTQRELMIGPAHLEEFIMPWFRRLTDQAHGRGYQVLLHSCGSIHRVIGRLIDAGVECLHPLQARAYKMDAETLAKDFGGRVAFLGGIDTQDLLVNGTPAEVKADVRRVKQLLGPRLIVSPSHEALLPNVPPANVAAMAEAALEI
jgi:uroporphyrinogen decarboxylase